MTGRPLSVTIREVREGNKCKVQLVVHGEVVKETSLRGIGLSPLPEQSRTILKTGRAK